jgi:GNAT superfamily N-acetyltransferase
MLAPMFDAYRQSYGQSPDLDGAERFVSERLEQSDSAIFLALRAGDGCGFTQLYPAFSSVAMRPIWILNDLFVALKSRRFGVGRRLVQAATDFASESGAKRLVLATTVDNHAAQALYEQMGWGRNNAFIHYNYEL